MNSMNSLEAAAEAAAKVNAMLIAKGKLKPPPSAVSKVKGTNVKSAGDLFTAEVEINDAPLSARNLLTRGHTQDEINKYSGAAVSTRGRYMTFEEKAKNSGGRPLYLYVQASEKHAVDLGVHRIHEIIQQHMQNEQPPQQPQPQQQQQQQQQVVVAAAMPPQQQAPSSQPNPPPPRRNTKFHKFVPRGANGVQQPPQGNRPPPLMSIQTSMPSVDNIMNIPLTEGHNYFNGLEKVFVGLDHAAPTFDLRNKVIGSGGTNLLYIRNETGAVVTLRGKGSGYIEPSSGVESPEPMYLCIEHPKFEGLQSAKQLAQNLVETLQQEFAQWQQQQQQQMNTLAMQNSVLHPTQFQAMGMGQPGVVTVHHQPLQQQELLQSNIQGMVATSVALPVVSNMPTLLAGQLQHASQQLAGLQQHQVSQQQQSMHAVHQQMALPPHIQTGPPPLLSHHQQPTPPPPPPSQQQQGHTMAMHPHHQQQLQMHAQQAGGGVAQQGVAFPSQLHQAILSPLQAAMAPQAQGHHAPPPPPQQLASITQMAQQTVQGTLLVSPGQMVFTQAPVSSPQHHHHPQGPGMQHPPSQQQAPPPGGGGPQTPPPPPPSNQQPPPPAGHLQHMPTFQQMYIPQQQQQQGQQQQQQQMSQQQPGMNATMALPPMAMTMHPPPMHHPQPVPMPGGLSGQMNNAVTQHSFMSIPSNQHTALQQQPQQQQINNSVPMGASYPPSYQQFAGGMSGGGSLPTISYPIFRQEQRPPPVSSEPQKVAGKRRFFSEESSNSHAEQEGCFQLMPAMGAMGQPPPPPPPPHSPNSHHQPPPPRQGNGLQEMMQQPPGLAPPPIGSGVHHPQLQHHHQQQQQHLPQHQQQDRDKQLMPPPPPPLPSSGEKRPSTVGSGEPELKRHKGSLSSVSGYGSDEEDQSGAVGTTGGTDDPQSQQSQSGNSTTPYSSGVGAPPPSYAPPKTTFSHYSSKPQMYGPSSTSVTASTQVVTSSGGQSGTSGGQQASPPGNAAVAFQGMSPCQQPPPNMHHHQAPMFAQPTLPPPPPSYQQQPQPQQQQQGMAAFAGYQYNSSLPFWMVQQ
ncbi:trithorax group protein osa-like isoform X2 [Ischnura elegans]|uniref:trithorax group protein osa-like isoform X2 n=1 Tax=Ischnura elegans TaxID=197161 RepID=UPI001ED88876|nr:trithorax group protein osa-like isoform X2 [Ischnura elegans]